MDAVVIDINADTSPYVLFSVDEVVYGISSSHVLSIEILSTPTPLVNAPPYTLGILDFRGDMIPLIGLRALFGKNVRGQGLRSFMQSHHSDHEEWMTELEDAVRNDHNPKIELDSHKCRLGSWLSSFTTQNNSLANHITRLTHAHLSMHKMGKDVLQTAKTDKDKALEELAVLNDTYAKETFLMVDTCADAYLSGMREMLLVLNVGEVTKGIVVDDIVSVEYINQFLDFPENGSKSKYVRSLARRDKDNSTVQLIDEELMIEL